VQREHQIDPILFPNVHEVVGVDRRRIPVGRHEYESAIPTTPIRPPDEDRLRTSRRQQGVRYGQSRAALRKCEWVGTPEIASLHDNVKEVRWSIASRAPVRVAEADVERLPRPRSFDHSTLVPGDSRQHRGTGRRNERLGLACAQHGRRRGFQPDPLDGWRWRTWHRLVAWNGLTTHTTHQARDDYQHQAPRSR
jgi:hypothetical protein